jgi:ribosome-binding factor A
MSKRLERYSATLQGWLAEILHRYQLPGTTVSVTNVQVSPDLKYAEIWVSVFGPDAQQVFEDIAGRAGEISRLVAAKSTTKFSPRISVKLDEGMEDTKRIEQLLDERSTD